MSYDLQYLGRNLNGRILKAVQDFELEVSRITRQAAAAGALHGSRTFIELWSAGVAVLEREVKDAIHFTQATRGRE